ncbi:uncharacterized protein LOC5507266 [Nematostella vectensis]|uniref:uncharacterized protein LOC5507266 n=1 Tax=Nematostella vectensis TaxID=45351 RepID=UPI002076DA34|nr:uncharacterized protein LOC5507266 [Nematostella vectensis]
MTETLAQTRLQLQNAESSVLFMQQEHAQTLKGLYAEISKLQKKCGELTFKIAMNATSSTTDEGQLCQELSEAQETIKTLRSENTDFKAIIDTGYKRIVLLETQLNGFEQKYNQDIMERDKHISILTKELTAKSDTVAYLTTQLHQSKIKNASRKQEQAMLSGQAKERKENSISSAKHKESSGNVTSEVSGFAEESTGSATCVTPSPPAEKATGPRVRRPFRRSATSPSPIDTSIAKSKSQRAVGVQDSPNEIRLNVSSAKSKSKGLPTRPRRSSSPSRPGLGIAKSYPRSGIRDGPPPDEYVEFLRSGVRPEPQVVVRAAPEPLPPISSNELGTSYRGKTPRHSEEVSKIIVSPLGSPEKGWRHKEHSQQSNGPEM